MNINFRYCPCCSFSLVPGKGTKFCPRCKWIHYDNPKPVVAVLVVNDKDEIVLVKRNVEPHIGEWCLPCGFVDKYEGPDDAAIRETKEECGLDIKLEQVLLTTKPGPNVNQALVAYLGRIIGGELKYGDDADGAEFFSRENCPRACFSSHRYMINNWFDGFYRNGKYADFSGWRNSDDAEV